MTWWQYMLAGWIGPSALIVLAAVLKTYALALNRHRLRGKESSSRPGHDDAMKAGPYSRVDAG